MKPMTITPLFVSVMLASASLAHSQSNTDLRLYCLDQRTYQERGVAAESQKAQADVSAQHTIAIRNCRGDRGCEDAARQQFSARLREIANKRTEDLTRIQNRMTDCMRQADQRPVLRGSVSRTDRQPTNPANAGTTDPSIRPLPQIVVPIVIPPSRSATSPRPQPGANQPTPPWPGPRQTSNEGPVRAGGSAPAPGDGSARDPRSPASSNPGLPPRALPNPGNDPTHPAATRLSPALQAELEQRRAELRVIRNDPGRQLLTAGNEFFRGLTDSVLNMVEFLAQPRGNFTEFGIPARQVIDYLVHHSPESFGQRYNNAVKAVEQFRQNPAYAMGVSTPAAVGMTLSAYTQFASEVNAAAKVLNTSGAAANRFGQFERGVNDAARSRAPGRTPAGRGSNDPGVGPPPLHVPTSDLVPPTCYMNQCLRNAVAVDKYWKTGVWNEPKMRGIAGIQDLEDLPASPGAAIRELRAEYGNGRALDPLHGEVGQEFHAMGVPVYSSRLQVTETMRTIGSQGQIGQGIVILIREEVLADGTRVFPGHVANVRGLPNGKVEFFDRAASGPLPEGEWQAAKWVYFFRTR